jgi:phosphoglycolate phosphatase-like HAD superfamily hydrolase
VERQNPTGDRAPHDAAPESPETPLPMLGLGTISPTIPLAPPSARAETVAPRTVERGVVAFDLDGTVLDDVGLISHVAGDVLEKAFGTPAAEARIHYLATTGMPFEAQIAQLYPEAPKALRDATARTFHERKVREAYGHAGPFPEIPGLLKRLSRERWTMVISTGAEREMAEMVLERDGLRYWFEDVLGSAQGTKREHLAEYRRRYPGVPIFLVGDSRFDMEAGASVPGVIAVGRATVLHGWTLTPDDLRKWGAAWADFTLSELPEALARLERRNAGPPRKPKPRAAARRRTR